VIHLPEEADQIETTLDFALRDRVVPYSNNEEKQLEVLPLIEEKTYRDVSHRSLEQSESIE
jgi:hypothetical protein